MKKLSLKLPKRIRAFLITATAVIVIDHLTKWIVKSTMHVNQEIKVLGDFFTITFIYNTGIAFGILNKNQSPAKTPTLVIVSLIALAVIFYIFTTLPKDVKLSGFSMGLIFGGAIGNIADRIIRGKVVDFFDVDFFDINIPKLGIHLTRWPTFNVADSAVLTGTIILFIIIVAYGGKTEEQKS